MFVRDFVNTFIISCQIPQHLHKIWKIMIVCLLSVHFVVFVRLVVVVFIVNIVIVFDDLTFSKLPNSFKENNEKPFNFSYKENIHFEERKKEETTWVGKHLIASHNATEISGISLFLSLCRCDVDGWMDGNPLTVIGKTHNDTANPSCIGTTTNKDIITSYSNPIQSNPLSRNCVTVFKHMSVTWFYMHNNK